MSNLKKIIVELENCVHDDEQYSGGVPVVWSREFQKKISRNTNHWNDVQRKKSHVGDMDFQDEEDDNIRVPYDQEEEERQWDSGYNYEGPQRDYEDEDEYKGDFKVNDYGDPTSSFEINDYEKKRKKSLYGDAYRKHKGGHEEEEETNAKTNFSTRGMRSEKEDDCDACYGTGMDFPRLKGDCSTCGGSGKATKEEQAEEDIPRKAANAGASLPQGRNENPDEQDPENVAVDDQYGLDDPNDDEDFGEEEVDGQQEWDDPNYQGVIRTVPNSHLVFKRQNEDGTFDELWQYNLGDDFKKELKVRRAILAGTDIPINKMRSPDNSQNYELWTVGNGQMLKIRGLPN